MNEVPISLFLVSGFLGSGKSSFLVNVMEKLGEKRRIGIVQNEFSSINIDSRILRQNNKGASILEVNKGSVFCLCLLNDFIPSLSKFIDDTKPDIILIEATGLSDPLAILQMINSPIISGKVRFAAAYTIIDGYLFKSQIKMLKSVSNQIKIADTVLINKSDKISKEESLSISSQIKEINPFCNIINTEFAKLPDSAMDTICNNTDYAIAITKLNPSDCKPMSSPPEIKVDTISTVKRIKKEDFGLLADQLKSVLRAKGFIRSSDGQNWTLQAVAGEISFREYNCLLHRTEMVFFGDVNTKNINNLFKL